MDSVPLAWRLSKNRYSLTGTQCKSCGTLHFPPRKVCDCGSETGPYRFSGDGKIVSYTVIHTAPDGFEASAPYTIGLIQLTEGPVISGHVIGVNPEIGKNVSSIFRKLYESGNSGVINYCVKFELVE
ncbi:Zn-ribbon domain-containing OB-fold protein [Candidatus Woesearchaeota archaeon]|nr:Zn-ribbon domain-containing OB-fold protein [Candidatus Woesearchaeota archaeon]